MDRDNKSEIILDSKISKLEKIEKKLLNFPKKFEASLSMFDKSKDEILKETYLLNVTSKVINLFDYSIKYDLDSVNELKSFVRKTTVPLNYIEFILGKPKKKNQHYITAPGTHYIYALPGGGKSSLAFDIIEEIRVKTGLGSYVNCAIEKPKYDDVNDFYFKYHSEFEVEDFFGKQLVTKKDGTEKYKITQLKNFDRRFRNIVFDELLSWLNHRMNNTGDYLQIFIALIQFLAQRRHRNVDRVYFLNQLDTTDIQLMSSFNYVHEVQVDLDVPYWHWVETGCYDKHILGWWIDTYKFGSTGKKTASNKILIESHYRPRTADFDYFDSFAEQKNTENLPFDKLEIVKGV